MDSALRSASLSAALACASENAWAPCLGALRMACLLGADRAGGEAGEQLAALQKRAAGAGAEEAAMVARLLTDAGVGAA